MNRVIIFHQMALAPKPPTLSSAPQFPTPHPYLNPNPKPFCPNSHSHRPHTLIICKSRQSDITDSSVSIPESDCNVPPIPTRGDIFLHRHQSAVASTTVFAEIKEKKKNKDNKLVKASSASTLPSCYGCGAPLQTSESDAPGYVECDTYNLKKKHRQLRTLLCGRCRLLSHGHMITAVGGNGGYSGGKQFVTAEELRQKLSHLRHEKALIVKLVDIVDFNGSFLARIRDLAGANPIILVVTKVDLLPKGTDFNCVGDWVVEATLKKKLNILKMLTAITKCSPCSVVSVHLTSSKSLVGIAGVISEIQKEKKPLYTNSQSKGSSQDEKAVRQNKTFVQFHCGVDQFVRC
ncbi:nitric oxide associated protein 1 [Orobanche gracilis]